MKPALYLLLLLPLLLNGCSWFGSDDNSDPPAELKDFDKRVELRRIWSRSTGDGTDEQFLNLAPAVVGSRVYVADRDGSVWAVELEDGKTVWHTRTGLALSAGVGVGNIAGLALVGTSEGQLAALDLETGEPRWQVDVSSEVLSVPQVVDGVVVVQTVDGNITGLDAETGERRWIHDRSVPVLTLRGSSTPLVQSGVALAGFASGKLVALDTASGRDLWEVPVAVARGRTELQRIVDVDANPVLKDGVLYSTSYQGQLVAISLRNGQMLWKRDMSAYAGLAVDSSQVFVSDASSDLWALDRRSGRALWKQDALLHRSLTGPAVVDTYVGVGDFEGYVHVLSSIDGSIAGRTRVDSKGIAAAPVTVFGDRLLILGAGGQLALYQIEPV